MSKDHHSQYVYHASAYGFAAELQRPIKHSIPTQAAAVLAASGGRGTARVHGFKFDGVISVEDSYSEVGGSFDECHDLNTTYAFSVLEGVNIADVLTADRIVSRLTIYVDAGTKNDACPKKDGEPNQADLREAARKKDDEPRFDITGSHFENLKIAGHKVDVKLATSVFHKFQKYSQIVAAKPDDWLAGSKLDCDELDAEKLKELANDYHGLPEMVGLVKKWKPKDERWKNGATYVFSPANHLELKDLSPEILRFGNTFFIPKFGIISLAEMVVHKHCRTLTMFRVHMCSASTGSTDGAGTGGSGGSGTSGG